MPFLCTAFDHGSADFLADTLGCTSVKVPSPEITNRPLLKHMARKFKSLLLSTGASTLAECAQALLWIEEVGEREIALMHCLSEYPAPLEQANLRAMLTMRAAFQLPVGYSDHTEGSVAAVVATALGASMIEKHYTLDKKLPGPDHQASLDMPALRAFVTAVRGASASLGLGKKEPAAAEAKNRALIRKSVTCALPALAPGTRIEKAMLGIKRPWVEGAVAPADMEKICGLSVNKQKTYDEPILWRDFD
jgi:N-acetylneuraminate synthase/N,N'-diacetyllegionaminate synthase